MQEEVLTPQDVQSLVKRNTALLASGQALSSIAVQINSLVAPLAILQLTGNVFLAGLIVAINALGRTIVSYFCGAMMDKFGRRPILILGAVLTVMSFISLGALFIWGSVTGMLVTFFVYGLAWGISGQNNVAIADMHLRSKTGTALGYLYTASIIGALISIPIVGLFSGFASSFGKDPYSMLWIAVGGLNILAVLTTFLIKPDTKEIAIIIGRDQYENHEVVTSSPTIRRRDITSAFLASAVASGIMTTMMALLSLHMHAVGFALVLVSLTITIHVTGMYAPSLPFGRLVDRFGTKIVMLCCSVVSGIGALLTPITSSYYIITLGIFLVGAGWCGTTIATTTLLAAARTTAHRGRILGLNGATNGAASTVCPLLGSSVIAYYGFYGFGIFGLALSIPAIIVSAFLLLHLPLGFGVHIRTLRNIRASHGEAAPTNP